MVTLARVDAAKSMPKRDLAVPPERVLAG
jgi:hypothetical protein